MAPPTYENQESWKKLQAFLPPRLAFVQDHSPIEEWWPNRGHTIHLDRWLNPSAKIRLILHHGVGTNGRQMSMILGVPLHKAGFELVALDMPGYGCTAVAQGVTHSYDDWVQIAVDFIDYELQRDPRPIVLYGLSAGGMLTYHAAALSKKVKGIVGMTFLDQRIQQVADETSKNLFVGRVGVPFTRLADRMHLGSMKMATASAVKMSTLVNSPEALDVFMADTSSAGSQASLHFLATYLYYKPVVEPEDFDVCPILLTQPAEDKWTPLPLSELVLSRVKKVPVKKVMLENAGHYPLEDPGLQQMADAIIEFLHELSSS